MILNVSEYELAPRVNSCASLRAVLISVMFFPFKVVFGLLGFVLFLVFTITGIGPLIECCKASRDRQLLDRNKVLQDHPEMFLLTIPAKINKASNDKPYKVMVRLTKSTQSTALPAIVMPGGLAANLTAMARLQDELTRNGFTVLAFDRLGVGYSDPNEANLSPSARDVAFELDYVMRHCGVDEKQSWIQIGGSMGSNVAAAFVCLFPGRLVGFLNLDGLPPGFVQVNPEKFLRDGPKVVQVSSILCTGIMRFFMSVIMGKMITQGSKSKSFTDEEVLALVLQPQQWQNTALEYATLMSCCDLENAAWGNQATTSYDNRTMYLMATLAPAQSVVLDEIAGVPRSITDERSASELGDTYTSKDSKDFRACWAQLQGRALSVPSQIDTKATTVLWPSPPKHPVGNLVGGVEPGDIVYPLAPEFAKMVVRVMTARSYVGLEDNYPQIGRNHSMARSSLHALAAKDGANLVYPKLSHMHLWQQTGEIVRVCKEIATLVSPHSSG